MTIFDVYDKIKKQGRNTWYQIPSDFYATAETTVDHNLAATTLTHHRNHWAKQDITTHFKMSEPIEIPIWDPNELAIVFRNVVKVTMTNEKIKQFKP